MKRVLLKLSGEAHDGGEDDRPHQQVGDLGGVDAVHVQADGVAAGVQGVAEEVADKDDDHGHREGRVGEHLRGDERIRGLVDVDHEGHAGDQHRDTPEDGHVGEEHGHRAGEQANECEADHVDAVLPVLHGPYGEDGTVQGLLEMMGVPYVGCGVFASAACMDKHYTKVVLNAAGIPTAPGIMVDARAFTAADVVAQIEAAGLAYPLFVKPSRAGSSFGVTKVDKAEDLETQQDRVAAAIATAGEHDWKVLIEQGIDGRGIHAGFVAVPSGGAVS